jgi:hypothetical protein
MNDYEELIAEAREALGRINTNAFDHDLLFQYRGGVLGRELTLIVRDLADALEAATSERDDLATRLSEYLCDSTGGLLSKTGYDVRTMVAHTEEYYDRVHAEDRKEAEAERDAAVEAVERVRAIHRNDGPSQGYDSRFKGGYGMLGDCCATCGSHGEYGVEWPCPTIAALDVAPEPEWEWAVSVPGDDEPFSDVYQTREHLAEQETGIAWGEEQLVRRRPAGPWIPVEGEGKTI